MAQENLHVALASSGAFVRNALMKLADLVGDDPRVSEAKLLHNLSEVCRVIDWTQRSIVNTPHNVMIDVDWK